MKRNVQHHLFRRFQVATVVAVCGAAGAGAALAQPAYTPPAVRETFNPSVTTGSRQVSQSQQAAIQKEGERAAEALAENMRIAKAFNSKKPQFKFAQFGCFFGAHLKRYSKVEETFPLKKGATYIFFAAGDKQARNVDLRLFDSKGRILGQDTKPDVKPVVEFKPSYTGRYKVVLSLPASASPSSFCVLTVLSTDGFNVSADNLATAGGAALVATTALAMTSGGRFYSRPNSWALYGGVMQNKTGLQTDLKPFRSGPHMFMATGDKNAKDLDLYLVSPGNQALASSTDGGGNAVILGSITQGRYSLAVNNLYSTKPAFAVLAILDLTNSIVKVGGPARGGTARGGTARGGTGGTSRTGNLPRPSRGAGGGSTVRSGILIEMDGEALDIGAVQVGSRVLVPMAPIWQGMGETMNYNRATGRITASLAGNTLRLQIGSTQASYGGETGQLDAPPQLINGMVMLPLRFLGEVMGAEVKWDQARRRVIINTGEDEDDDDLDEDEMMDDDDAMSDDDDVMPDDDDGGYR